MNERVVILGVGLIGGSLALGFKEHTNCTVIGYDVNEEPLAIAQQMGAIDEMTLNLSEVVHDADIIIIALPVEQIKQMIIHLSHLSLKEGCIISDVGSTKSEIMHTAKCLNKQKVSFIGGHPMAGSHRSGIQAARSRLFENAFYVLTPDPDTPLIAVQRLSQLLHRATKAEFVIMDPFFHDQIVGAISHLPHIIAAGLVNQVGNYNEGNEWFHRLAAGGFRDLTRIGASHPAMWRDILLSNRDQLITLMDDWIQQMRWIQQAIKKSDREAIETFFERSRALRTSLPERGKKGLLPNFYHIMLDIPDQPGEILAVISILGRANINLANVEVLENREEVHGVLKLTFKEEDEYRRAIQVFKEANIQFHPASEIEEAKA